MPPEDLAYRSFQQPIDRPCFLIVAAADSDQEIDIEKLHLRTQAMRLFPKKLRLYDWIYESRFRPLRQQFRSPSNNLDAEKRS